MILRDKSKEQHETMICVWPCAGGELRAAGQAGGGQADVGQAGQPESSCQELVQTHGQSAQQDALLQRKIMFSWFNFNCTWFIFI